MLRMPFGNLRRLRLATARPGIILAVALAALVGSGCDGVSIRIGGQEEGSAPQATLAPAQEGTQRVELQVVEGPNDATLAFAPVFIQGQGPFAFALDTGASQSVLDQDLVQQLGLQVVGTTKNVTGVAGQAEAQILEISDWRIGQVRLPAATIVAIDLPDQSGGGALQGLLGSDMLSQFGVILVDYERGVLELRPRSG